MALPTDTAIVPIDHELEKLRPRQLSATSPMPLNVTVEDYFSDEEAVSENRQQHERLSAAKKSFNETTEHQPPKSTIRVSTLPKQANVSWFDEPVSQKSQTSGESRRSRISQATTAVPPSPDGYLNQSYPSVPVPRVRTSRPSQVRWVDDDHYSTSESAENENRYHRREPRRITNNLPPGPTPYAQSLNKAPQTFNYTQEMQHPRSSRYFEPQNMYPAHSRYLGHDTPLALYQPWPYPYPYEHPGTHETYGSAFRDDRIYPGSYINREPTPWDHGKHLLPPPRPLQPPIKPRTQNESNNLIVPRLIPAGSDAQHKETDTKEGTRMSEKLEELLQKYEQALKQHSEVQQNVTAVEQIEPPPVTTVQKEGPLTDMDLIQLMGERMLDLKRKNEEKLLEANQVLKYLGQNSYPEQQNDNGESSSSHIQGARSTYARIPTVYQFRTLKEGPNHEDADGTSVDSDRDSIAGNSSGSSISSLAPISRQVQPLPAIADRQHDRRTDLDSIDFDDGESISSTEPEDKSTVSRAEPAISNSRATEGIVNETSEQGVVKSAAMLATELDIMGELIALRRDLSILKRQTVCLLLLQCSSPTYIGQVQGNKAWLISITRPFVAHIRKYFRQIPRPGTQRLEWTCVSRRILLSSSGLTALRNVERTCMQTCQSRMAPNTSRCSSF
jgi:hypothetical protein